MTFNQHQGFTLIEALVALSMLVFGVVGLAKVQSFFEITDENAQLSNHALLLADQQLELLFLRGQASEQIEDSVFFDEIVSIPEKPAQLHPVVVNGRDFTLLYERKVTSVLRSEKTKKIDVIISWNDRWNKKQSVTLTTALSKYNEFSL